MRQNVVPPASAAAHPGILLLSLLLLGCAIPWACREAQRDPPSRVTPSSQEAARAPLAQGTAHRTQPLGAAPLCEASAAIVVGFAGDTPQVLVADNEVARDLFRFELHSQGLHPVGELRLEGKGTPRDIEALVAWPPPSDDAERLDFLVIGSHSRNKRCERKGNRQRVAHYVWHRGADVARLHFLQDNADHLALALSSREACTERLLRGAPLWGEALCQRLVVAEEESSPATCESLNIEGALVDDQQRLWLALRAPLLDGDALLLRVAWPAEVLTVDAIARLSLGGRGVREIHREGSEFWVVAGPVGDAGGEGFALLRFAAQALADGVVLQPEPMVALPQSTEALVRHGRDVIALTDGAEGDKKSCKRPATQVLVPLP